MAALKIQVVASLPAGGLAGMLTPFNGDRRRRGKSFPAGCLAPSRGNRHREIQDAGFVAC